MQPADDRLLQGISDEGHAWLMRVHSYWAREAGAGNQATRYLLGLKFKEPLDRQCPDFLLARTGQLL